MKVEPIFMLVLLTQYAYGESAVLTKTEVESVVQKCIQESPPPAGCAEGDTCHVYLDQSPLCANLRVHLRLLINEHAWDDPAQQKMVMKSPGPFLNSTHAATACGGPQLVTQTGPVTWRCRSEGL